MPAPLTYVIVVNWNGRDDTLECLASLGRVEYPLMRVLVVDNGSTDGSQDAIRREYPGVMLLETGSNLRFAGGNNAGIRYALANGAEQVALLNNDTTVDPGFLGSMTARMQSPPAPEWSRPKFSTPRSLTGCGTREGRFPSGREPCATAGYANGTTEDLTNPARPDTQRDAASSQAGTRWNG